MDVTGVKHWSCRAVSTCGQLFNNSIHSAFIKISIIEGMLSFSYTSEYANKLKQNTHKLLTRKQVENRTQMCFFTEPGGFVYLDDEVKAHTTLSPQALRLSSNCSPRQHLKLIHWLKAAVYVPILLCWPILNKEQHPGQSFANSEAHTSISYI